MNMLAFSKIMKKYDKVCYLKITYFYFISCLVSYSHNSVSSLLQITSRKASISYMNMVDNSYIGSSDEVSYSLLKLFSIEMNLIPFDLT